MMKITDVLPALAREIVTSKSAIERQLYEPHPYPPVSQHQDFYVKNCAHEDEVTRALIGRVETWLADKPGLVVVLVPPEAEMCRRSPEHTAASECQPGKWHAYARLGIAAE